MRRAAAFLGVVLIAACSGHSRLSQAIEDLALPNEFVVVGEDRYGPSTPFAGDHPHIDRFYASFVDPEASCALLQEWAADSGFDEAGMNWSSCGYRHFNGSDWIDIQIGEPLEEIPVEGSLNPILVDLEYSALLYVRAGP